jgi:transposase-like protein
MNLSTLVERFGSDEACREYLERLRWPDGVCCPRCGDTSVSEIRERNQWDCNSCRYQFSVTAGTIFHDTHLPLWKWFAAILLIVESKKGISASQLGRMIGVSYKTAWYLSHRIREAMATDDANLLSGIIQLDETYVGGKVRGKGRGFKGNKAVVVGAVQRGGQIRLKVVKGRDQLALRTFICQHTSDDTEVYFTDEHPGYDGINDQNTRHERNHSADEYVYGDVHTKSVENVWSLLKRSIVGSFHKVSVKHLDRYLDELEWRFNNQGNPYLFRDTLYRMLDSAGLPYQRLTARAEHDGLQTVQV